MKLIKLFTGIFIFICTLLISCGALKDLLLSPILNKPRVAFLSGLIAYNFIHNLWGTNDFFATFTHELNHAIACTLCGGKVYNFSATRIEGGHISSTKSNFFISLSPYVFPIYSILFLIAYRILI